MLLQIQAQKGRATQHSNNDSYLSSGHHYYDVSVPARRLLAREWIRNNPELSEKEFISVLHSLYQGKSHEEKTLASILLGYNARGRKNVTPKTIDAWLDHLIGWAEIDSLCQNVFAADEFLARWKEWNRFLGKLSRDRNINKRRASLVFLTGPVCYSSNTKLSGLAFEIIDALKGERDIIITKAVSWLLRSMVKNHKQAVLSYVKRNQGSLPKIAIRETMRKIQTGRK